MKVTMHWWESFEVIPAMVGFLAQVAVSSSIRRSYGLWAVGYRSLIGDECGCTALRQLMSRV